MWLAAGTVSEDPTYVVPVLIMQEPMGQPWVAPYGHYPIDHGPGMPYAAWHPHHQMAFAFDQQQHQIQGWAPALPRVCANASFDQPPRQVRDLAARTRVPPSRDGSTGYVPVLQDDFPALGGHSPLPDAPRKSREALDALFNSRVPQRLKRSSDAAQDGSRNLFRIALNRHIRTCHVGRSDQELEHRLETSGLTVCSTFYDEESAQTAVNSAIAENRAAIDNWLHDKDKLHRKELTTQKADLPIGKVKYRSKPDAIPVHSAQVIIERAESNARGFRLITAFPVWP